ncbi:hypothetical protein AVEN_98591-1 [Araneus ventricosus]|uniref:Uncharacterized protein n=1 Tax=Araneus ventricosus TaxID=182803 RepID=A0A4Y2S3P4_ARAVE|nr:hypothetical protein AVEN_98591-1 [Araneus ventricosus]
MTHLLSVDGEIIELVKGKEEDGKKKREDEGEDDTQIKKVMWKEVNEGFLTSIKFAWNSIVPVHSCTCSFQRACFGSSSLVTSVQMKAWLSRKPRDEGELFLPLRKT